MDSIEVDSTKLDSTELDPTELDSTRYDRALLSSTGPGWTGLDFNKQTLDLLACLRPLLFGDVHDAGVRMHGMSR